MHEICFTSEYTPRDYQLLEMYVAIFFSNLSYNVCSVHLQKGMYEQNSSRSAPAINQTL